MSTAKLTINLDALVTNWRNLDALTNCETAAVVKANGYGLDAGRVGQALAKAGARNFFVAIAEEGVALRRALGPGPGISVFAGHMEGDAKLLRDFQLTPMLNSLDQMLRHFESLPGHAFGVQLDSFADFLSFVLVPVFLIFQAVYARELEGALLIGASIISIYYVISGLRRLIHFNLNADAGEVENYFTGVPTPLGAILLWLVYLTNAYELLPATVVMVAMLAIGWTLNSQIKVKHP